MTICHPSVSDSDLLLRISLRRGFIEAKLANHQVTDQGCWEYKGYVRPSGYGKLAIACQGLSPYKKSFAAHRLSYALHSGTDPGELFVCHTCDNPSCINPAHLFLGTPAANSADMVVKGRSPQQSGTLNNSAMLDESRVRQILSRLKSGQTNKDIAGEFGVTHSTISAIRVGKIWQEVANDENYEPQPCFKRKKAGS